MCIHEYYISNFMKQSILGMLPYNDPWATIMQLNGHLRIYKTIIPYITCKLVSDVWKIPNK